MADYRMPALGADMETGKVVQWLVAPGSRVKSGDVVAVIETHKGAIDCEIFLDGVIEDLVPVGTELPIGAVLAHVRVPGEDATKAAAPAAALRPAAAATGPAPAPVAPPERAQAGAAARSLASPAARRRAQEAGVDVGVLHGTGVDGSVTLADVELAAIQPRRVPGGAASVASGAAPRRGFDPVAMRQGIAAAMSRSKREIPHYYLTNGIDFDAAGRWLAAYNAEREPRDRLLPAVLLLKACVRGLQAFPQLNGFYMDGAFQPGTGFHVGWAIALRGGGLIAPALHDVDRKTLPELMAALRDLVERTRSGGLRSSELTDPTVTVTSLGDRGAQSVLGVIYPPQVAIVGFGRIDPQPWVVEGQLAVRPVVTASLAGDHRASDGHLGGKLLDAIGQALQRPAQL